MKGHLFAENLNLSLEIKGESWHQGETVEGQLSIKNLGSDKVKLDQMGVALAIGEFKKVHANESGALKKEIELSFPAGEVLPPQKESTLPFKFTLDPNAPITDKKSSYFLYYGHMGTKPGSHLQLLVNPQVLFRQISECFERFFRFKLKEVKNSSKGVTYKFKSPGSREFASIESADLTMKLDHSQDLVWHYQFQTKKIDGLTQVGKLIKEKPLITQKVTPKDYSLGKDMINQEKILTLMREILDQVKMKII